MLFWTRRLTCDYVSRRAPAVRRAGLCQSDRTRSRGH